MARTRQPVFFTVVLLAITAVSAYVEELDDKFKEARLDELWLVEFYAPWCTYCKVLDPIWYEVGAELKSLGSPVKVGKIDASLYTSIAKEFDVHGYPSIKLFKDDQSFDYEGPRTKDAIIDFTNRVAGPAVRSLSSPELFQHVMSRHDVLFLYIGGKSPLKEKYLKVASDLIIHTSFFCASHEILPKAVTLEDIPSVAVFKDGTYSLYNENQDADLSDWVNRERFLGYIQFDSFTLYQMGNTGKLVALAVIDEKNPSEESIRYKNMLERVATEYKDNYNREFQFGYMEGNDYVNGLIMGELAMPSVIVLNMSNEGYFLPKTKVETTEELLKFLNSILKGSAKERGGNGAFRRVRRLAHTVSSMFHYNPVGFSLLSCLPLGMTGFMCWVMCKAVPDDKDSIPLKMEGACCTHKGGHPEVTQGEEAGEEEEWPQEEEKNLVAKKKD